MLGVPPLRAPPRVIPGRTLLGVRVGLATGPPLNFKLRLFPGSGSGLPGYLYLYPPENQSAQGFTSFPIGVAVEIGMPLAEQFLGAGIGADLPAALAVTTRCDAIGDHGSAEVPAEVPGACDAPSTCQTP